MPVERQNAALALTIRVSAAIRAATRAPVGRRDHGALARLAATGLVGLVGVVGPRRAPCRAGLWVLDGRGLGLGGRRAGRLLRQVQVAGPPPIRHNLNLAN